MTTPPFVIPFGAAEASNSFSTSITTTINGTAVMLPGDVVIIGLATDDTNVATSVTVAGCSVFDLLWSGVGPSNVSASLWGGVCAVGSIGALVNANFSGSFDDVGLISVVCRGSNPLGALDPGVPNPTVTAGSPVVFSSSKNDDLSLFFSFGHSGMWLAPPSLLAEPGWTYLSSLGNSGGFGFIGMSAYSQQFTAAQTNATATPTISISGNNFFAVLTLTADISDNPAATLVNLPHPVPLPCLAPCEVCFDPSSHAKRV